MGNNHYGLSLVALLLSVFLVAAVQFVQAERISEQKCKFYHSSVKTIIPLRIKPKPINFAFNKCQQSVNLIVGGEAAQQGEFPHQVLIGWPSKEDRSGYQFPCGGSLISDRFVLTAAHCGYLRDFGKPRLVRVGEHDLATYDEDHADFEIEAFIKHPMYSYKRAYYDIALVKLVQPVLLSKKVLPACLWTEDKLNYTSATATGFGLMETAGYSSNILQKVDLRFVSNSWCDRFYKGTRQFSHGLDNTHLCMAAPHDKLADTCQGDSGGPIQVVTNPKGCMYHVVAITSIGGTCGALGSAAVYTKVSSYIDWIERIVWG